MSANYLGHRAEIAALRAELAGSEGVSLYHGFLSMNTSWNTFECNFHELFRIVQVHFKLHSERKLGDFHNRAPLNSLLLEATTRLHNFVFSAKSLAEHTRNFVKHALKANDRALDEYQRKVSVDFVNSGLGPFTKELRDFFAHVSSPFIISMIAGDDGAMSKPFALMLDTAQMRKTRNVRKWSAGAISYADGHGGRVDLETYVLDYYGTVIRFYEWLDTRNGEWCKAAWEHAVALEDRIEKCTERWSPTIRS